MGETLLFTINGLVFGRENRPETIKKHQVFSMKDGGSTVHWGYYLGTMRITMGISTTIFWDAIHGFGFRKEKNLPETDG